jgi:hypothetical protein
VQTRTLQSGEGVQQQLVAIEGSMWSDVATVDITPLDHFTQQGKQAVLYLAFCTDTQVSLLSSID